MQFEIIFKNIYSIHSFKLLLYHQKDWGLVWNTYPFGSQNTKPIDWRAWMVKALVQLQFLYRIFEIRRCHFSLLSHFENWKSRRYLLFFISSKMDFGFSCNVSILYEILQIKCTRKREYLTILFFRMIIKIYTGTSYLNDQMVYEHWYDKYELYTAFYLLMIDIRLYCYY